MFYKNDLEVVTERFYIHRSTLFYKIEKIKELAGINLEQTDEVASLYFS
jgi:DNA-binding PucR family transcriptional regulator